MPNEPTIALKGFSGLDNTSDPATIGLSSLVEADNAVLLDNGWPVRRAGLTQVQTGVTDAFATRDGRLYLLSGGNLLQLVDGEPVTLATDVGDGPAHWCQADDMVFCSLGFCVGLDRVMPWGIATPNAPRVEIIAGHLPPGIYQVTQTHVSLTDRRESGAKPAVTVELTTTGGLRIYPGTIPDGYVSALYVSSTSGSELSRLVFASGPHDWVSLSSERTTPLRTQHAYPPPSGGILAAWAGRVYVALTLPERGMSIVFSSLPTLYHHFRLGHDFFTVPGKVTALADSPAGLLIGTDRALRLYNSESLQVLLPNASVAARSAAWDDNGRTYLTTSKGVVAVPGADGAGFSFLNNHFRLPVGPTAGAGVTRFRGSEFYLTSPQPGPTDNPYTGAVEAVLHEHGITLT